MIVGSGLLSRAFARHADALHGVCIYAAGVSNSACRDPAEFGRDRTRLETVLDKLPVDTRIVYFSTCSIGDPWSQENAYTQHKRELERIVRERGNDLVVRLPQVAGDTPNPHTLLNYLYNRIVRSERFDLWQRATRNIIDVADAARIIIDLLQKQDMQPDIVNVANSRNATMTQIVAALERATQRPAVFNLVDRGGDYPIDVSTIGDSLRSCGIYFDDAYLTRTIDKYYGRR
ncbi:MAG: NAD-dependent epimerase/dehydratase family protein [Rudaea sp.]